MTGGSYKIRTVDGVHVDNRAGNGYTQKDAEADAKRRNERAEKLGLKVRYEAVLRGS